MATYSALYLYNNFTDAQIDALVAQGIAAFKSFPEAYLNYSYMSEKPATFKVFGGEYKMTTSEVPVTIASGTTMSLSDPIYVPGEEVGETVETSLKITNVNFINNGTVNITKAEAEKGVDWVTFENSGATFTNNGSVTVDQATFLADTVVNAAGKKVTLKNAVFKSANNEGNIVSVENLGTFGITGGLAMANFTGGGTVKIAAWEGVSEGYTVTGDNNVEITYTSTLDKNAVVKGNKLFVNKQLSLADTASIEFADAEFSKYLVVTGTNKVVLSSITGTSLVKVDAGATLTNSTVGGIVYFGKNTNILGTNTIQSVSVKGTTDEPGATGYRKLTIGNNETATSLTTEKIQLGATSTHEYGFLTVNKATVNVTAEGGEGQLNLAAGGSLTLMNGASVTTDNIVANGTVEVATDSSITATNGFTGSGIINVSEIVDGSADNITVAKGAIGDNLTVKVLGSALDEGAAVGNTGYYFTTAQKNGVFLTTTSNAELKVGGQFAESSYGTFVGDSLVGFNAFGDFVEALDGIGEATTKISCDAQGATGTLSKALTIGTFTHDGGGLVKVDTGDVGLTLNAAECGNELILRALDGHLYIYGKGITVTNAGNLTLNQTLQGEDPIVGSATVTADLTAANVQIDGNAEVDGNLTAQQLLWLRNGKSNVAEYAEGIFIAGDVDAETVLLSSGNIEFSDGDNDNQQTVDGNSLIIGAVDDTTAPVNVVSTNAVWTINSNMLAYAKPGVEEQHADSLTLNGGSITFQGGKSSIQIGEKTVANDLVLIENANFTLNLNGADLTAKKVSNAGTINLAGGVFTADEVSTTGAFNVSGASTLKGSGTAALALTGTISLGTSTITNTNVTGGSFQVKSLKTATFNGTNTISDINSSNGTIAMTNGGTLNAQNVTIADGGVISIKKSGTLKAKSLTISKTGTYIDFASVKALNVEGEIKGKGFTLYHGNLSAGTLNAAVTLSASKEISLNVGTLKKNLTINPPTSDPMTVKNGVISASDDGVTVTTATNVKFTGTTEIHADIVNTGALSVSGALTADSVDTTADGATFTVTGAATQLNVGAFDGTIKFSGGSLGNSSFGAGSDITIDNKANFIASGATIDLDVTATLTSEAGVNGGAINIVVGNRELTKNTYKLVGGALTNVTISIDGTVYNVTSTQDCVYGDYTLTTLGGNGLYLTNLSKTTVYVDSTYTPVGKVLDEGTKLVGWNAGKNNSIVNTDVTEIVYSSAAQQTSTTAYGDLLVSKMNANLVLTEAEGSESTPWLNTVQVGEGKTLTIGKENEASALHFTKLQNEGGLFTVEKGSTLTIDSGKNLERAPTARTVVNGTLVLNGQYSLNGGTIEAKYNAEGDQSIQSTFDDDVPPTAIGSIDNQYSGKGKVVLDVSEFTGTGSDQVTDFAVRAFVGKINAADGVYIARDNNDLISIVKLNDLTSDEKDTLAANKVYVNTDWAATTDLGTKEADGEYFGVNAFNNVYSALQSADRTGNTAATLVLESDIDATSVGDDKSILLASNKIIINASGTEKKTITFSSGTQDSKCNWTLNNNVVVNGVRTIKGSITLNAGSTLSNTAGNINVNASGSLTATDATITASTLFTNTSNSTLTLLKGEGDGTTLSAANFTNNAGKSVSATGSKINVTETVTNNAGASIELKDGSELKAATITNGAASGTPGEAGYKAAGLITASNGSVIDTNAINGGKIELNGSELKSNGWQVLNGTTIEATNGATISAQFATSGQGASTVSIQDSTVSAGSVLDGRGAAITISGASKVNTTIVGGSVKLENATLSEAVIGDYDATHKGTVIIDATYGEGTANTVTLGADATITTLVNDGTINAAGYGLTAGAITGAGTINLTVSAALVNNDKALLVAPSITDNTIVLSTTAIGDLDATKNITVVSADLTDVAIYKGSVAEANLFEDGKIFEIGGNSYMVSLDATGLTLFTTNGQTRENIFVNAEYTVATAAADGKILGFNAFNTLAEALAVVDANTTAITVKSDNGDTLAADLDVTLQKNLTISGEFLSTINFAECENMDIVFRGSDKLLTVDAGAAIAATGNLGRIWILSKSDIQGSLSSDTQISFYNEADVTGTLDGGKGLWIYTNAEVTIDGTEFDAENPQAQAYCLMLTKGVLNTKNTTIAADVFKFDNAGMSTTAETAFTLNSDKTVWNIAYRLINDDGGPSGVHAGVGTFNFTNGSKLNITGTADVSEADADKLGTADISANMTINLSESSMTAAGAVTNAGTINVGAATDTEGSRLDANNIVNNNAITLNTGAHLTAEVAITNNATGVITVNGGSRLNASVDDGVTNDGTINLNAGAKVLTNVTNNGSLEVNGVATIEEERAVTNAGTINLKADATLAGAVTNNGAITLAAGSTLDGVVTNNADGEITANGAATLTKAITTNKGTINDNASINVTGKDNGVSIKNEGTINVTSATLETAGEINNYGTMVVTGESTIKNGNWLTNEAADASIEVTGTDGKRDAQITGQVYNRAGSVSLKNAVVDTNSNSVYNLDEFKADNATINAATLLSTSGVKVMDGNTVLKRGFYAKDSDISAGKLSNSGTFEAVNVAITGSTIVNTGDFTATAGSIGTAAVPADEVAGTAAVAAVPEDIINSGKFEFSGTLTGNKVWTSSKVSENTIVKAMDETTGKIPVGTFTVVGASTLNIAKLYGVLNVADGVTLTDTNIAASGNDSTGATGTVVFDAAADGVEATGITIAGTNNIKPTVTNNGKLIIAATAEATFATVTNNGSITVNGGTKVVKSETVSNLKMTGALTNAADATITVVTASTKDTLQVAGNLTNNGTITIDATELLKTMGTGESKRVISVTGTISDSGSIVTSNKDALIIIKSDGDADQKGVYIYKNTDTPAEMTTLYVCADFDTYYTPGQSFTFNGDSLVYALNAFASATAMNMTDETEVINFVNQDDSFGKLTLTLAEDQDVEVNVINVSGALSNKVANFEDVSISAEPNSNATVTIDGKVAVATNKTVAITGTTVEFEKTADFSAAKSVTITNFSDVDFDDTALISVLNVTADSDVTFVDDAAITGKTTITNSDAAFLEKATFGVSDAPVTTDLVVISGTTATSSVEFGGITKIYGGLSVGKASTVDVDGSGSLTATVTKLTANTSVLDVSGVTAGLGTLTSVAGSEIDLDWKSSLSFTGAAANIKGNFDIDVTGLTTTTATKARTVVTSAEAVDLTKVSISGANAVNDFAKYFVTDTVGDSQVIKTNYKACNVYVASTDDAVKTATAYTWGDANQYRPDNIVVEGTVFGKAKYFSGLVYGDALTTPTDYLVTIEGGDFQKIAFGGTYVNTEAENTRPISLGEDINIVINDGTFEQDFYGGDNVKKWGKFERNGAIAIEVNGGTFTHAFGAGSVFNTKLADLTKKFPSVSVDSTALTITGGTFQGAVYGGCSAAEKAVSKYTFINEDATVTLVAGVNDIVMEGVLTIGSYGYGNIGGTTNLILTGDTAIVDPDDEETIIGYTKIEIKEIWGGCGGDYYTSDRQYISAGMDDNNMNRHLTFKGFVGALACDKITAFSNVEVLNGTRPL